MSDNWCGKCGKYLVFTKVCGCKPFECRHADTGEDFGDYQGTTWAHSEEGAAKKFVEYCWQDDPCDPGNIDEHIEVRNEAGEVKAFGVSAEASVDFYAKEIKTKLPNSFLTSSAACSPLIPTNT